MGDKVTFITNEAENNLRDILNLELAQATSATILVAFTTAGGLSKILENLENILVGGGQVTFMTGLYQAVTEPEALRLLVESMNKFKHDDGSLDARISLEQQFHSKLYLIKSQPLDKATIIVGSSNLTSGGLRSGGETSIMIQTRYASPFVSRYEDMLDKRLQLSVPLTAALIDRYEKSQDYLRKQAVLHPGERSGNDNVVLDKVLGKHSVHQDCDDAEDDGTWQNELRERRRKYARQQYQRAKEWKKKNNVLSAERWKAEIRERLWNK